LQVADEIQRHGHQNREDRRGGEGRNEQRERGQQRGFDENDEDAGNEVGVEGRGGHLLDRESQILGRCRGELRAGFGQNGALAEPKDGQKQSTHEQDRDGEQGEDPGEFAEQVAEARHGLCEDRVDRAVLHVLRQKIRRRKDGEERAEDRHGSERDVFQHLELLLEGELRDEGGIANDQ